jgi:succinate dehydrogenase flavoprotein subunit
MRSKKLGDKKQRKCVNLLSCDLLIIGGGGAGLRAAIEAHDSGADVLIVSKSRKGDPHTVLATGGINAALATMDHNDNWMIHAADTLKEGCFLADYEKVMTLCKNAPEAILELVKWGAIFHKEPDGRLTQRFFGAHSYRRTCFFSDQTGKEIIRVLMKQVEKRKLKFMDNIFITRILKKNDQVIGALGIDFKKKGLVVLQSKCIILAGGGYSRIYSISSSRDLENYGEGVALAYGAGAELADMEMVQFHPSGMIWPKKAIGILATESIRGEGGILLNSKGERFMKNYNPRKMELGPRDEVARAIYNEIILGRGTNHGGVWLDITHLPKKKIQERLPRMYRQFKNLAGVDISKQKMEVAPTAHYSMGGVKVDNFGRTKIKGLFAVGEVTGQLHGANRLGGNSLLETIVFGKIVGREAAMHAKQAKGEFESSRYLDLLLDNTLDKFLIVSNVMKIRCKMQELMQEKVGIIRDANRLQDGLNGILEIKKSLSERQFKTNVKLTKQTNKFLVATLDLKSSLVICEAIIRSALMRNESRGAHYRSDFPKQNDETWMANIYCVKNEKGTMHLFTRNVKTKNASLKHLHQNIQTEHHLLE